MRDRCGPGELLCSHLVTYGMPYTNTRLAQAGINYAPWFEKIYIPLVGPDSWHLTFPKAAVSKTFETIRLNMALRIVFSQVKCSMDLPAEIPTRIDFYWTQVLDEWLKLDSIMK